ncbi:short chain dehydrogenase family protein [Mycobacterium xenopi 3993]|nr:short chain dehydrogenase family protein [Mycobacterium xenopi 3993]
MAVIARSRPTLITRPRNCVGLAARMLWDWSPMSVTPGRSTRCSPNSATGGRRTQRARQRGRPSTVGSFEDLTDDQWRQAFDDGVMGMVHCVRSALPLLRTAAWARIVNFSAHSTQRQSVVLPAYTAAKAALTSISKNLSLLLAKDEILVNVVSPGSIASESLVGWAKSVGVDGDDPYQLMDAIAKHFGHPAHLPRAGLPDEIGPVVAFLASRRNSYMTGANVNVDGGSDFT